MKRTKTEIYWLDENTASYRELLVGFIIWAAISFLVYLGMLNAEAEYLEFMSRPDAGQILFSMPTYEIPGDSYWMIIAIWMIITLIWFMFTAHQLFYRVFYIPYLRRNKL